MDKIIAQIHSNLESIKRVTQDENSVEFWSARDLMPMLGYIKWQKFIEVIEKAQESCKISGQPAASHFLPAPVKSSGGRPKEDYFLTRFACYLIAQNGDPRKPQIALAQTNKERTKRIKQKDLKTTRLTKDNIL